jgi:serine/threonine protein kinase
MSHPAGDRAVKRIRREVANRSDFAYEIAVGGGHAMTTGLALESQNLIADRFILEALLGRGSLGAVYRARDLQREALHGPQAPIAIKVFNEEFQQHAGAVRAVLSRAREALTLTHPNIVRVHDIGRKGAHIYMTMELLQGESLDRVIGRTHGAGVGLKKALKITRDICDAIAYAHGKLSLHTGLKPANVFLTDRGAVKVLDFGIARAARRTGWASNVLSLYDAEGPKSLALAPTGYVSADDLNEPDSGDDVHAVACVFYELLTGKHPYGGCSAEQALQNKRQASRPAALSRSQWRVLKQALAAKRDRPPLSVIELWDGLQSKRKWPLIRLSLPVAMAVTVSIVGASIAAQMLIKQSPVVERPAPVIQPAAPVKATAVKAQTPVKTVSKPAIKPVTEISSDAAARARSKQRMIELYALWRSMKTKSPRRTQAPLTVQQSSAPAAQADALLQVSALKERLQMEVSTNRADAAVATLDLLKSQLPASDSFIAQEAPQAIADSYLRLAAEAVRNESIENALNLAIRGSRIAPAYSTAATARNRYLAYWEISDLLRNQKRISVTQVRLKIWRLSRLAPQEMPNMRRRWQRDLNTRILSEQNPQVAAHLSRVRQALFSSDSNSAEQVFAEQAVTEGSPRL